MQIQSFNGVNGPLLSSTVNEPWTSAPTATNTAQGATARLTGTLRTTSRKTSAASGGWTTSTVTNSFDALGRTTATSSSTDATKTSDDTCSASLYADNTAANVLTAIAQSSTSAGLCTAQGTPTGNVLNATRVFYQDSTSATPGSTGYKAPAKPQQTRSEEAVSATGQTVTLWQTGPTRAYDSLGRVTSSTDRTTGKDRKSTVSYSPATGPPATITSTNPLGWQTTATTDPVRGTVTSTIDAAGATTSTDYDASGRAIATWDPLRPKTSNPDPSVAIEYSLSQTAPSWIRTNTRNSSNGNIATFQILDGMGTPPPDPKALTPRRHHRHRRDLQRQWRALRPITYHYYLSESPSGTLRIPAVAVPSSTDYTYDGAGRVIKSRALANDNQELWSTTVSYPTMDTTTVTGPEGNQPPRSSSTPPGTPFSAKSSAAQPPRAPATTRPTPTTPPANGRPSPPRGAPGAGNTTSSVEKPRPLTPTPEPPPPPTTRPAGRTAPPTGTAPSSL